MSTNISRRQALGIFGTVGIGAALTACAGPGGSSQPLSALGAPKTGPIEGEVSFAHWRAEDKDAFDALIKSFVTANPQASVAQSISTSNDYNAQALQKLRGGTSGDAFATFRGAQFTNFAAAKIYTDLTDTDAVKNYDPGLLSAGQSKGRQLGLPYQVVFPMPMANLDLFDKAGADPAPTDWAGFLGACESLKTSGVVPMAWPAGDVGNAGQLFNCMIVNNAPTDDMCSQIEKGTLACTDDWFIAMLKQYQDLIPYFQPNSTGTAVEPAEALFAQQQAAMLVTGSYHLAAVRGLGAQFPIDLIFPNTTTTGTAKYEGVYNATFILGVNSASTNQPAAMAWVDFLSQPENAATYANLTAQHVTVTDVEYTNADLQATSSWLSRKTGLAARFQFENLDVRNAVEASCIAVVSGTDPEKAAASAQQIVDQNKK
jgi:raffinose/stachyose/melibiose transport system substrate-binding protein